MILERRQTVQFLRYPTRLFYSLPASTGIRSRVSYKVIHVYPMLVHVVLSGQSDAWIPAELNCNHHKSLGNLPSRDKRVLALLTCPRPSTSFSFPLVHRSFEDSFQPFPAEQISSHAFGRGIAWTPCKRPASKSKPRNQALNSMRKC